MTTPTPDMLASDRDLEEFRWALLRQRADICLDAGLEEEAAGWRWLADNKRWPRSSSKNDARGYDFYNRMDSKVIDDDDLPADLSRFWDNHKAAFGLRRGDTLSELLRRAAIAAGAWLASQPTPKKQHALADGLVWSVALSAEDVRRLYEEGLSGHPRRRTRAEVLAERERAVYGGCCERFANNQGCNCLEEAEG